MDSISFSFLLYEAYCVALYLVLPIGPSPASTRPWLKPRHRDVVVRTSWSVFLLAAFLFAFIDMVIDPVALRGDRWFLGKIYYYPDPGIHSGVPFANYVGWAVVGLISLAIYFPLERRLPALTPPQSVTPRLLPGVGLSLLWRPGLRSRRDVLERRIVHGNERTADASLRHRTVDGSPGWTARPLPVGVTRWQSD
ncbi:MAG: carotenoid biosynthesis protein [Nitrospirae bacterium]|nr:carotenoid biosynthesis protein [Nitrospirota bacterium]MDE3219518.1 carotenoid biosynthesis protein [Nitrospirota bacterium]